MRFRMGGGCGPRGIEIPAGLFAMGVRPARLGAASVRATGATGAAAAGGRPRPRAADVRFGRAAARPAQADRRPAAPRLRPHPRDRGDDRRRLCAEPGRRLSDPDHAPGHGADRGAARPTAPARRSRPPPRAGPISPSAQEEVDGADRAPDRPRRGEAEGRAARRSAGRSATCSPRSATASPATTWTRNGCTKSPPSSTRRRSGSSG